MKLRVKIIVDYEESIIVEIKLVCSKDYKVNNNFMF